MNSVATNNCGFNTSSCEGSLWAASNIGILNPGQTLHQSEWAGAWMNALVLYSTLHLQPCIPPISLLRSLNVSNADILTEAAVYALGLEYGTNLPACVHNLVCMDH